MNKQGNTLQHYIDVLKWVKIKVDLAYLIRVAIVCYDLNVCTSDCIDRSEFILNLK